jgi:hypothetical protein
MNLIEGGRPRIGCIRRQPSAGSLILSLEEGHPSMGKIAGSSGKRDGLQEHRSFPGQVCRSRRRRPGGCTRGRDGSSRDLRGAGREQIVEQTRERVDPSESRSLLEEPKQQHRTGLPRARGKLLEAW